VNKQNSEDQFNFVAVFQKMDWSLDRV